MKKIILLILASLVISCKNKTKDQKDPSPQNSSQVSQTNSNTPISEAIVPSFLKWRKFQIQAEKAAVSFNNNEVYKISRSDIKKSGYVSVENIDIYNGSIYQVSVVVRQGDLESGFGLRLQSVYPNRVDAIFDLKKGEVVSYKVSGNQLADSTTATIDDLGEGWFKCSLKSELKVDQIRVIMGPTKASSSPHNWETATMNNSDVLIVPNELKISEF